MIKVDIILNGTYWRTAEIAGINKHFSVRVEDPACGRGELLDVYVEEYANGEEGLAQYYALIQDDDLEVNDEYTLRQVIRINGLPIKIKNKLSGE
ncbi:hypothetical protein KA005_81085 [bacterium]|nr:hypothetical protein [bacterium]